jgi:hypothetical protein
LEQPVEEDLRLALFIALDVLLAPGSKKSELVSIRHTSFVVEYGPLVSKRLCAASGNAFARWMEFLVA